MRAVGPALAGVLAVSTPVGGHAAGPGSNLQHATEGSLPNIVLVWDGGGSGGHPGAIGGRPAVSRASQWNRGAGVAHRGQNRPYGPWAAPAGLAWRQPSGSWQKAQLYSLPVGV